MLTAYTGVLASPGFVFVEEQPGRLDDQALATRLGARFSAIPGAAHWLPLEQPAALAAEIFRLRSAA